MSTRPAALLLLLILAACGKSSDPSADAAPTSADDASDIEKLIVYSPPGEAAALTRRFGEFTRASGIHVVVESDDDIVARILRHEDRPTADLLLTVGVGDVWLAADEGALRPMTEPALLQLLADRVPAGLRDADNYWAAIDVIHIGIVSRTADDAAPAGIAALAATDYAGRLCLPASGDVMANTLAAGLVVSEGRRPAERQVRKLLANASQPLLPDSAEVVAAVAAGDCDVGLVSWRKDVSLPEDINLVFVAPAVNNAVAIGISRHAKSPQAAEELLAWMIANVEVAEEGSPPLASLPAVGANAEEATLLLQRARYP